MAIPMSKLTGSRGPGPSMGGSKSGKKAGALGGSVVVALILLAMVVILANGGFMRKVPSLQAGSTLTGGAAGTKTDTAATDSAASTCPAGTTAGRIVVVYGGEEFKVVVKNWITVMGGTVLQQQDSRSRMVVGVKVGQEKAAISGLSGRPGVINVNCEGAAGL